MHCLLLGGGGAVGVALLYLLQRLGWSASVADPKKPRHEAEHAELFRRTVQDWEVRSFSLDNLDARLRAGKFDLVLDLAPTVDKFKSVSLCDEHGVPLVNSTMVDCWADIHIAAFNFICKRPPVSRCPHIVAAGMNPGAVNAMAEEVITRFEQPDAICFWEYDDTLPCDGVLHGPVTTWSEGESADELTEDWTFEVLEEGSLVLHEDALSWAPERFQNCGAPMEKLGIPPETEPFLIGHEECVYLGWRHDTAVKFVYAFHAENMQHIRRAGYGWKPELLLQQPGRPLVGRDIVGVSCRYDEDHSWEGRYCTLANSPAIPCDTNATCMLVASGIVASAMLLAEGKLPAGVHLTHELPGWMAAFRTLVEVHDV
ncbi:MAG: saccharopine dehydrogenase NADP-binding domain-containing protein [Planctomycetota bacterium]